MVSFQFRDPTCRWNTIRWREGVKQERVRDNDSKHETSLTGAAKLPQRRSLILATMSSQILLSYFEIFRLVPAWIEYESESESI